VATEPANANSLGRIALDSGQWPFGSLSGNTVVRELSAYDRRCIRDSVELV